MNRAALTMALLSCSQQAPQPHVYVAGTQAGAPWPIVGHDEGFTARSDVPGARGGQVKWKVDTGARIGTASPVVAADGTIYIGNTGGTLVALHRDGSQAWRVGFGGAIDGSPTIGQDGSIYVGAGDAQLHVLHPDGSVAGSLLTLDAVLSPIVLDADGTAYFGVENVGACWTHGRSVDCPWRPGPLFAIAGGRLYGYRAYDSVPPDLTAGTPFPAAFAAALGDGTVYLESNDYQPTTESFLSGIEVQDRDGNTIWKAPDAGREVYAPPVIAVATATSVYVRGETGVLQVGPNGTAWSVDVGAALDGRLAVDSEGVVYFGANDGNIHAVDAMGKELFSVKTGAEVRSSPAIGSDGTIYIGSDDGFLYAVGP